MNLFRSSLLASLVAAVSSLRAADLAANIVRQARANDDALRKFSQALVLSQAFGRK